MGDSQSAGQHRPRVLWSSESPAWHTGLGRTTCELTRRLAAGGQFEIGVLGWGARVDVTASAVDGLTCFDPDSIPWSASRIDTVVERFAPDVVVLHGPLSALDLGERLRTRPLVNWIRFGTFEAAPLAAVCRRALSESDRVVVPSAWCWQVAVQAVSGSRVLHIPLGCAEDTFRPLPERDELRREVGLCGRFVVGCVARNQFRKQLPILMKAFSRFTADHPEGILYLHTDPDDAAWSLAALAERLGIADRTLFTRGVNGVLGLGSDELNRVYNLFDIMVLPTMGEAFGLPVLEAMAAGVPVVATDCSAMPELLAGRGELIAVSDMVTMPWDEAEYALADVDDLVRKLELLRRDEELRSTYSQRGREFALSMTWDHAAARWTQLLREAVGLVQRPARIERPWVRTVKV